MDKKKKIIVAVASVIVVSVLGLIVYRIASGLENDAVAAVDSTIEVQTDSPQKGDLVLTTEYIGKIEPNESVSVLPKVSGQVLNTYFEVGQTVKKGDLLYEVDPQDIELSVNVAAAAYNLTVASVQQQLTGTDSQMVQAQASAKSAKNSYLNASDAYHEYDDRFDDQLEALEDQKDMLLGGVNLAQREKEEKKAEYETALSDYKQTYGEDISDPGDANPDQKAAWEDLQEKDASRKKAEDNFTAANASYQAAVKAYEALDEGYDSNYEQLETAKKNASIAYQSSQELLRILEERSAPEAKATAEAQINQAKASYDSALQQLENTKIYSPIDGVIEAKNVDPLDMTSPQSPAYVVSNKEIMVVTFSVPANVVGNLETGDKVTVENGSQAYQGTIIEVATMVDQASGLFKIKARIDDGDGSLLSGISVKVSVDTERAEDGLLLPVSNVYYEDYKPFVYVADGDTAKKVFIELGVTDGEKAQVVSGLSPADKVISSWHPSLGDGAKIRTIGEAAQVNAAVTEE
ncbi:efflux RND transporter periplasmic adaptor subunit [Youxingia wuxianensis]|uniref:Efflux RND transporter periplasmic adaptor subunit n=1 Tax=Youxingia wuxianensis TaxID=2763678 RepID=A0A926EPN3_9FIRM|nr:efflux RND transporter periplasmic adaptor subunit [Youxingia wuxianensis]MBC8584020.1 efflux RND transporter periplasmic adaptor subunit [Youxingia wuxianensis]